MPPKDADKNLRTRLLKRIDAWAESLVDMSRKNALISFKPSRGLSPWVESPDIESLFAPDGKPKEVWLRPPAKKDIDDDEDNDDGFSFDELASLPYGPKTPGKNHIVLDEKSALKTYRGIERLASQGRSDLDNKGLRTLYMAFGFVRWTDPKSRQVVESPLVLSPIEITRKNPRSPHIVRFVDDAETVVNPALSLKLRNDVGLELGTEWEWENKPLQAELDEIEKALSRLPGAEVLRKAAIGRFFFHKLAIYNDLRENRERIADHWMVKALDTGGVPTDVSDAADRIPSEDQLDEVDVPLLSRSVLDADASQRRCILGARNGASLVIQGPPGTGKSQTIANIIAELIAAGRSVLFVSEKLAALEVVQNRLEEVGLDNYLLPLHGTNASRKEIVESLDQSVRKQARGGREMSEQDYDKLSKRRNTLNGVVEALHQPRPVLAGKSVYEVNADVTSLYAAPRIVRSSGTPGSLSEGDQAKQDYARLRDTLRDFVAPWSLRVDSEYPWRGLDQTSTSAAFEQSLEREIAQASSDLQSVKAESKKLADGLGQGPPASVELANQMRLAVEAAATTPGLPSNWFESLDLADVRTALTAARAAYESLEAASVDVRASFKSDFSALPDQIGKKWVEGSEALIELLGDTPEVRSQFVSQMSALLSAVGQLPELFRQVSRNGRVLAEALGRPAHVPTVSEVEGLADFMQTLRETTNRPLEDWLDELALDQAHRARFELGGLIIDYQTKRDEVLSDWSDGVFALPVTDLIDRFTNQYTGFTKVANSQYRADSKSLKAVSQAGKLPADIVASLSKVQAANKAQEACGALKGGPRLGDYYAADKTDLQGLDEALALAQEALTRVKTDSDFGAFRTIVCSSSPLTPDVREALRQLRVLRREIDDLVEPCRALLQGPLDGSSDRPGDELADRLGQVHTRTVEMSDLVQRLREARGSAENTLAVVTEQALSVDRLRKAADEVSEGSRQWNVAFGNKFAGAETDWHAVEAAIDFAASFPIPLAQLSDRFRQRLSGTERAGSWPSPAELGQAVLRADASMQALTSHFSPKAATPRALTSDFTTAGETLERLGSFLPSLREWTIGQDAAAALKSSGWGAAISELEDSEADAKEVVDAFERAFWFERVEAAISAETRLRKFSGTTHNKLIDEFRLLDQELIRTGRTRVADSCNAAHPGRLSLEGSETRTIELEARKKRNFKSARRLLSEIPTVLPRLKPCLMMSPLNVSQFLTADAHFDVVIFDEASQVRTQDAINAIYRCDQVIVAGDNKQLPPSNFWETSDEDVEEDEDHREELESLLDEAEVALQATGGVMTLRWHYRSRHQDLIAFSNSQWYQNNLLVFASPRRERPVIFNYVAGGVYDRGKSKTNRAEAEAVVDRLLETVRAGELSVGVVAFNTQQATLIEDLLSQRQAADASLDDFIGQDRLNGVFVKNLENVQGDERDVILISLGYGNDSNGKFTMNFGPLNKDGGPRRLNVAVSRARDRLEVFSSVQPEEFTAGDGAAGPSVLRNYLAFARDGIEALANQPTLRGGDTESPFEESVLGVIEGLGYQAVPQVGVASYRIDLGVVHPDLPSQFVLGIECDGATYHSSPVARDRDRLREQQLTKLGWDLYRIWSTDWIYNRPQEEEKLLVAIKGAIASGGLAPAPDEQSTTASSADHHADDDFVEVTLSGDVSDLPWVESYAVADLRISIGGTDFRDSGSRSRREKALQRLVEAEGPISKDVAILRLARHWNLKSRGSRVVEAGNEAVAALKAMGVIEEQGGFLSLPGHLMTKVRVPLEDVPESFRDLGRGEVPPAEVDYAIEQLAGNNGLRGEELVHAVSRLFGNKRTGKKIHDLVAKRVSTLGFKA